MDAASPLSGINDYLSYPATQPSAGVGVGGAHRAGQHLVVVAERGPLLLVAVSGGREPPAALARRLDLLHGQVTLMVTNALDRLFARNPRYDGSNLLGARPPLATTPFPPPWQTLKPAPEPCARCAAMRGGRARLSGCSCQHGSCWVDSVTTIEEATGIAQNSQMR